MAIDWTSKQIDAIKVKGHNTLVSAAAGSGKTTVLVERVIRMVTDRENPVDLDDLLIVTFTRAAARQMKTKIRRAISEKLKEDPENGHLLQQFMKVDTANISTLDALCRRIITENSRETDLDPSVRTINEDELSVLRKSVLDETLEEFYEEADPDFMNLVDCYMDRDDSKLEELVLKLFKFARSYPWPKKWLSDCAKIYTETDENSGWIKELNAYTDSVISGIIDEAKALLKICEAPGGPAPYVEALLSDIEKLSGFMRLDFDGRVTAAGELKFSDLSKKKAEGEDTEIREKVRNARNKYKYKLNGPPSRTGFFKVFYDAPLDAKLEAIRKCARTAKSLLKLTERFMDNFLAAKLKEGVVDFNDIEHFALDSLVRLNEDGSLSYTGSADRTAGRLHEIIIDEYQDTNELQEEIVKALSAERFGRQNVYMVGDVKQSIYGFRQTCPELFNEKYNSYTGEARVILDSNFRSRKKIVDLVNCVFSKTMIPEVGGIDYTDGNELAFAANYDPNGDEQAEITFIGAKTKEGRKYCASLIAERIETLVGNFPVREGESFRSAAYSDIAILSRASNNPELEKALQRRGIPVEKETSKGFFSALEIRLAKALLYITDNPYQDIEFAALLHSPLVGLSASELACLKLFAPSSAGTDEVSGSLYETCLLIASPGKGRGTAEGGGRVPQAEQNLPDPDLPPALHRKIKGFTKLLEDFRLRALYMDLYDLVEYIFTESGLYNIVLAMPGGEVRLRNLYRLKGMAADFSEGSHEGLSGFCLNLKKMRELGTDYGQSSDLAGDSGAVKMMTIHKSKGLEFPIVILAEAGKGFNDNDLNDEIIIDRKRGVGLSLRDPENRIKETTLFKEALKIRKKSEERAEEGRLLYVALTRAKEKLIVVGASSDLYKNGSPGSFLRERESLSMGEIKKFPADKILDYNSYLKLISAATADGSADGFADIKILPAGELEEERAADLRNLAAVREGLENMAREETLKVPCPENASREEEAASSVPEEKKLSARLKFIYPHEAASKTPVKRTASGLEKPLAAEDLSASEYENYKDTVETGDTGEETGSAFASRAATRGTAYHRVFELLDYKELNSPEIGDSLICQIAKMVEAGKLPEEYAKLVNSEDIAAFVISDLGRRMAAADERGELFREKQFTKGDKAMIDGEEETLLMQGAIDAFFIEDGKAILVDYKTDRGRTPEELVEMYLPQQLQYKDAIERALLLPVEEMYLYSTALRKAVPIHKLP